MAGARELVHGTAIACGGVAALIRGPSGSGKSDLALRCLSLAPSLLLPEPVRLVADDQVVIVQGADQLLVEAPDVLRGKFEIRGIGIVEAPCVPQARLTLIADLTSPGGYERMPEKETRRICGYDVAWIALDPFEISAAAKLLMALNRTKDP